MYTSFFGLHEKPFAITPDPRYLYLSERHAEALAHLLYGITEAGGFIQLTGEVGTGKTTVVRTLLSRIPENADVAVIMNPRVTPAEFLLTICEELGLAVPNVYRDSLKELVDALNHRLLSAHGEGRRVVLIVDEAQNLSSEVLEQLRLLTNLETATQKLLQIILIGQPELRDLLARNELRQLAQRITGRYHLHPLTAAETAGYVQHRLRVAGATTDIFGKSALTEVHRLSAGIPRVINVICDRALLGAYTRELREVKSPLVRRAAGEVYGRPFAPPWLAWTAAVAGTLAAILLCYSVWKMWPRHVDPPLAAAVLVPSVTKPPPAKASEAMVSVDAILARHSDETSNAAAFRRLLSLWGTSLGSDQDACGQAARRGLSCLTRRGSWGELRVLNRPAILTLMDEKGVAHFVVLRELDDDTAVLQLGEQSERLPLVVLSRYWLGDFTLVWRPKVAEPRSLNVGMRGADVRWLRRSLSTLGGTALNADAGDVYDDELKQMVQAFQRARRLDADGIAGVQTLVALDTALGEPGTPTLLAPSKRGG